MVLEDKLHPKLNYRNFDELYRKNYNYVYACALRIVKDGIIAEDIVQETFLIVYKKLSDFRGESNLKTWLYRITTNKASSYVKKPYNKHERLTEEPISWISEDYLLLQPIDFLERKRNALILRKSLMKISEVYRSVLEMHLADYTNLEIAENLNLEPVTVRSRLHYGKLKLQQFFSH